MNFFEQQDRSKQATKTLLGLFTASVMFTGICIYFAVMLTINTTFLKWTVFGERVCQPIVATSALPQPREIDTRTMPLLPLADSPDYQLGRFSVPRFSGGSSSRSFGNNYNSRRTTYYNSTDRNSLVNPNPNCRIVTIWWDARVFFGTLISTAILMGLPSWWKINQLKAGGLPNAASPLTNAMQRQI